MRKLVIFFIWFLVFLSLFHATLADELDDVTKELDSLKTELKNKESKHSNLQSQFESIKQRVNVVEREIVVKEKQVVDGEKNLSHQKTLLNERARSYYKNISKNSDFFMTLFTSGDFSNSIRNFFYQKTVVDEDRNTIIRMALMIKDLEDKKKSLVGEKARLAVVKDEVDKQAAALAGQIEGDKQKIANLSQRQQSLIASKQASLNIPKSVGSSGGAKGCSSDLTNGKDPGFSPKIGFFTYGVPNRVGLNQYGAKGRAAAGQNAETILNAYYGNFELKKDYDQNIKIKVDGNGEYSIEDYVKRIYEIPADWPMEALKAQAIAARSYALAYTGNGGKSICTTESCQVFKPDPKGGAWDQAVEATKGWVMVSGGNPISAYFSSTHGGYVHSTADIGWSGTAYTKNAQDASGNIGSFADLQNNAYDKESPWFYCDWGSRSDYNGTAWLKPSEVADVANVISLAKCDSSAVNHLYQPDKPNPEGTDTWNADQVKDKLRSCGGSPVDATTDVSVGVDFGSGKTTSVNIGGKSFGAAEFKDWFNLRAPANVQIVGPLFNVEKH
ncbi:SpoIID/LytB domain-containing protein [Candidatus Microgenomates bacterium]|nr:SpoIID/LytB domain-containing protein [Candidatus Microgenomates bacterium]